VVLIKINGEKTKEALAKIQSVWENLNPIFVVKIGNNTLINKVGNRTSDILCNEIPSPKTLSYR